jgi:hypothetical protein
MLRFLLTAATLSVGCLPNGGNETERRILTFVIPRDYNGFLILAYDMRGGQMPDREYDRPEIKSRWPMNTVIEFDDQGIARYAYGTLPNYVNKQIVIERGTKRELALFHLKKDFGDPLPPRGVMRDGIAHPTARKHRRDLLVEVFLVGNPADFPDSLVGYESQAIDRLLLKHFGLPLPEKANQKDRK